MKKVKLELCVASVEAARMTTQFPIDRIETCACLEHGGLTPTVGFVKWIDNTFGIEQHVLIRQRSAGFRYSYDEIVVMRDDILEMRQAKVKGVVVGALTKDKTLDKDALSVFIRAAQGLELTFHRAFDEIIDWKGAMDELVRLGFKRILTSGQGKSVSDGSATLKEMVGYANGRIEIMAGGGVNEDNAGQLLPLGVDAIHFSGTVPVMKDEGSPYAVRMNEVNSDKLAAICKQIC